MATFTKKIGFENLLSNPSMTRDSNNDGVVDGWTKATDANASAEWFYDSVEQAQMMNVLSVTTGPAFPGVQNSGFIPVTPNIQYTFSVYLKSEGNISTGGQTGPRLEINWYTSAQAYISNVVSPVYADSTFTRRSITGTAPSNAAYAKVKVAFRCNDTSSYGTVWANNAQFQQGSTVSDYEEADFFTLIDQAPTYNKGWAKDSVYKETGSYGYTSQTVAAGDGTWSGAQLKYTIPANADPNSITIKFWADASRVTNADALNIFCNGVLIKGITGGTVGQQYTISGLSSIRRGFNVITLQHTRTTSSNGNSVTIDNFEVSWAEATFVPITLPIADVVKYLDFESDVYDSFFTVADKAPGYTYGFKKTERKSASGFYSYGVEDIDADGPDIDEPGRAPTIPHGSSAAAVIKFSVPVTAIDPKLKFKAMHDAEDNYDIGTYKLNGETIWVGKSGSVWEEVEVSLAPGTDYELLLIYTKDVNTYTDTDSVYIDDVIVYYNIPRKPYMLIATAPETTIKTGATVTTTYTENFEDQYIDKFFSVRNLAIVGGKPQSAWFRTSQKAYQGSYSFRARDLSVPSKVDFTFTVPFGVTNVKIEWWNYVSRTRKRYAASGDIYPRLIDEYKIVVNGGIWKQFNYCSPNLTASAYLGSSSKGWACPWGIWWKETYNLTPGKTYTFTFEMKDNIGDSSTIDGEGLCCIDELKVSWTETPGDILTVPPQPLVYLDGRNGVAASLPQTGFEAPPVSFAEYEVYGQRGSTYQATNIDPRNVEIPIRIQAANSVEAQKKIQEISSLIIGRPLALIYQYPEGEQRQLFCRYAGGLDQERSRSNTFNGYRKRDLIFRAFDPMWYGNRVVLDGAYLESKTSIKLENTGDAEVWPLIKIYGPGTNPRVKLTDPDNTQTFVSFKLLYSLSANRYILIDTRPGQKEVLLDDGTSLYQYLDNTDNQLFAIPQGKYAVSVSFDSGTDANTKLVLEYQLPYWGY